MSPQNARATLVAMQWAYTKRTGFTIVELLIVIVVIAILAAITIVAYTGIQDRAKESNVRSDLSAFMKKIEIARTNAADGLYPLVPSASDGISTNKSLYLTNRNNWYYCTSTDRTQYALGVVRNFGDATGGRGWVAVNGSIIAASGIDDASTCTRVGKASGSAMGFNVSTGIWASWVNG